MERYVEQLIEDIFHAAENVRWPWRPEELGLEDWISDDEEEATAPRIPLEEWTGIRKIQLPPDERLSDTQLHRILEALKRMLDAYNWSFVLQIAVPERIQYRTIRENFDQVAKKKQWHMGFFELCAPGTSHGMCALGEFCHCSLFEELFKNFSDEELSPVEERRRHLEIEIVHLKKKHGREWEKYYPYHLDPEFDDEFGNPYDYGFGEMDEQDHW